MSARATGEVRVVPLELRTLAVILIGALGTAMVGVMLVRETVSVGVRTAAGVPAPWAAGTGAKIASSNSVSGKIVSRLDEVVRRRTSLGIMLPSPRAR
jgi:hypothetical protein